MAQQSDKRPQIVKNFEIMQFSQLGIGVVVASLAYDRIVLQSSPSYVFIMQSLIIAALMWIILAITRKKSNVGKWIFVITTAVGIPVYIPQLSVMLHNGIEGLLSVVQLGLNLSSLYLLFQPNFISYLKK